MQLVSIIAMCCIYVTAKEILSILQDKIKRHSRSGKLECFDLHLQLLLTCRAQNYINFLVLVQLYSYCVIHIYSVFSYCLKLILMI